MAPELSTLNGKPSSALHGSLVKLTYMTLRERLMAVRKTLESDAELARIAGVSRSNVHQWLDENRAVGSLKAETAANIQVKTGFSAVWLALGKGPQKVNGKSSDATSDERTNQTTKEAQKLLAIIRAFQETDDIGRDAIWSGAKYAMKRTHGRGPGRGGSKEKHHQGVTPTDR